jgi:hypothetical protein
LARTPGRPELLVVPDTSPHGFPQWKIRSPSSAGRLEELDRVARGVVEQDLGTARAPYDVISEVQPCGSETLDLRFDVLHDELDAGPAAWRGLAPSGMGRPAELVGPLRSNRRSPRVTSAKAGAAFERSVKPKWVV